MKINQIRDIYDREQRIHIQYPGMKHEILPNLARDVSFNGTRGCILYSRLSADNADAVIEEQIAYFRNIGQDFEWKLYDYDTPDDLKDRLVKHGFEAEEPEAIMVLDVENLPPALSQPITHDIRRIVDPDKIMSDVIEGIEKRVWGLEFTRLGRELADTLRDTPEFMSIYVAYIEDIPASAAWVRFPSDNQFASLWGGSTLPQYRGRGLYTALVAIRVQEAIQRGRRFVTVDASAMSQPILEKLGFVSIATVHEYVWRGDKTPPQGAHP